MTQSTSKAIEQRARARVDAVLRICFRITTVAFLLGGLIVTLGQIVGIALGNGGMVQAMASDVGAPVCIVAGIAGLLAFARIYTTERAS